MGLEAYSNDSVISLLTTKKKNEFDYVVAQCLHDCCMLTCAYDSGYLASLKSIRGVVTMAYRRTVVVS